MKGLKVFSFVMMLIGITAIADMMLGGSLLFSGSIGVSCAMAAGIGLVDIDDVSDRDTHGSAIAYKVYAMEIHQLSSLDDFPEAVIDAEGKRSVSAPISLAESQKLFYMEAHDIPTIVSTSEKGDITTTGENQMVIVLGGNRDSVDNLVENHQGGKFILFYKHVAEKQWYIIGDPERPMILSNTETKDDKDGRYTTLTFKRSSTLLPYPFMGKVPELTAIEA